jgi:hypothetical protein
MYNFLSLMFDHDVGNTVPCNNLYSSFYCRCMFQSLFDHLQEEYAFWLLKFYQTTDPLFCSLFSLCVLYVAGLGIVRSRTKPMES